jgi:hypothetical protein
MKKMQSLGKVLSKNEQKSVIGGLMTPRVVECICDDGLHHWSGCGTTCQLAAATCTTACAPYGNTEPVVLFLTCTACF